jgi:tetratricopeptide (TPR) repeat protein
LAWFEKAFEVDPAYSGAHTVALHYWYAFGQLDQAAAWYAKGSSLDPSSSFFPAWLGVVFLDLGDPGRAESWINRSIELGPERSEPNLAMELLSVYQGDEAAAWGYGRIAAELTPFPTRDDWPLLALLRDHELNAGRYLEARALYEKSYPELLNEGDPIVDGMNYRAAIDLALILSRTGEQEQADQLLNRSLQYIQTLLRIGIDGYQIADAEIYALQGNKQKALSAIRQAIDEGWRILWWYLLKHDPNLESLHDKPEYQAMIAEIEADMAAQLAHVREMRRNGELEPIPEISAAIH